MAKIKRWLSAGHRHHELLWEGLSFKILSLKSAGAGVAASYIYFGYRTSIRKNVMRISKILIATMITRSCFFSKAEFCRLENSSNEFCS